MPSTHRVGLRAQGKVVRFLPSTIAPGPPDLDNRITSHRLLAMGLWSDDMEGHIFCFANLKVTERGDTVVDTQLDYLRSWEHKREVTDIQRGGDRHPGATGLAPKKNKGTSTTLGALDTQLQYVCSWEHRGEVTDIQVSDVGGGEVIVALASSTGGVSLGRLLVPRTPGATPEDVQMCVVLEIAGATDAGSYPRGFADLSVRSPGVSTGSAVYIGWCVLFWRLLVPRAPGAAPEDVQVVSFWPLLVPRAPGAAPEDVQTFMCAALEYVKALVLSSGGVSFWPLLVPRTLGATPEDVQVLQTLVGTPEDVQVIHMEAEEECLKSWVEPHKGTCTSVDIQADSKSVLSVGADGSIFILDPNATYDSGDLVAFKRSPSGYCSYSNGRWADTQLFVTVHCLQVHPSRPDVCATGGSGGTLAIWDLRFASRPLVWTPPGSGQAGSGDVWEVKFDVSEPESASQISGSNWGTGNRVVFATEDGILGRSSACRGGGAARFGGVGGPSSGGGGQQEKLVLEKPLLQDQSAICSFDIDPVMGRHVVCLTDSQELVYLHQGMSESNTSASLAA
eukprot:gene2123-18168_t